MGEIDEFDDAVDHGVAQGDEGIDASAGQSRQEAIQKSIPCSVNPKIGCQSTVSPSGVVLRQQTGGQALRLPVPRKWPD
jgi:hypothetical protein